MLEAHGQIRLKRLALLAGLLLLAAQTLALQHVHAEPGDAVCSVCASSLQDGGAPLASAPTLPPSSTTSAQPSPVAPALLSRNVHPTRARAPPRLSF